MIGPAATPADYMGWRSFASSPLWSARCSWTFLILRLREPGLPRWRRPIDVSPGGFGKHRPREGRMALFIERRNGRKSPRGEPCLLGTNRVPDQGGRPVLLCHQLVSELD